MSNLLVEIGNTAVKAAWSEGATLGKTLRYQGEMVMDFLKSVLEKETPEVMAVVSSKPLEDEDAEFLRGRCQYLMLLHNGNEEFLQRYGLPEYLSYDRAASLVAAKYLFKGKACSIFDFGTTLTVDFVDSGGFYKGGNISPGCRTRFKSLNRYSKSLPLVDTPEKEPREGYSIESSIEAGVISGMVFEIEGYIGLHPQNIVIFTGGDAVYFAKRMKNSIFVVSNMVLIGLALITDDYVRKNLQ